MRGSVQDLPALVDSDEITVRMVDWGEMTASLEIHKQDMDLRPLFKGLPDDMCQCPHWGYVIKGAIQFNFKDHQEVYQAGDIYYAQPGHYPTLQAGTQLVEFSPKEQLQQTVEVIEQNMAAQTG